MKAYDFKLCCRFSLCIDVNFSCLRDDWQLYLARVNQLHICSDLLLFTREGTLKKCPLSMSLGMLQAGFRSHSTIAFSYIV